MLKGSGTHLPFWQTQLPIDYLDTSLVQDAWENVTADLSAGRPARLWYIVIEQTNNGATAEDLELEITLPNPSTGAETAYTLSVGNAASGSRYFYRVTLNLATGDYSFYADTGTHTANGSESTGHSIPWVCRYVGLIRVRQTTTVDGTSAQIEVNINWEKLVNL